jgi:hypothetical protein
VRLPALRAAAPPRARIVGAAVSAWPPQARAGPVPALPPRRPAARRARPRCRGRGRRGSRQAFLPPPHWTQTAPRGHRPRHQPLPSDCEWGLDARTRAGRPSRAAALQPRTHKPPRALCPGRSRVTGVCPGPANQGAPGAGGARAAHPSYIAGGGAGAPPPRPRMTPVGRMWARALRVCARPLRACTRTQAGARARPACRLFLSPYPTQKASPFHPPCSQGPWARAAPPCAPPAPLRPPAAPRRGTRPRGAQPLVGRGPGRGGASRAARGPGFDHATAGPARQCRPLPRSHLGTFHWLAAGQCPSERQGPVLPAFETHWRRPPHSRAERRTSPRRAPPLGALSALSSQPAPARA